MNNEPHEQPNALRHVAGVLLAALLWPWRALAWPASVITGNPDDTNRSPKRRRQR